jgi:hypothetical protein
VEKKEEEIIDADDEAEEENLSRAIQFNDEENDSADRKAAEDMCP